MGVEGASSSLMTSPSMWKRSHPTPGFSLSPHSLTPQGRKSDSLVHSDKFGKRNQAGAVQPLSFHFLLGVSLSAESMLSAPHPAQYISQESVQSCCDRGR